MVIMIINDQLWFPFKGGNTDTVTIITLKIRKPQVFFLS